MNFMRVTELQITRMAYYKSVFLFARVTDHEDEFREWSNRVTDPKANFLNLFLSLFITISFCSDA
jgi:hypothetical protein